MMSSSGSLGQLEIGGNQQIYLNSRVVLCYMEIVLYNCQHCAVQSPASPQYTHRIREINKFYSRLLEYMNIRYIL